MSWSFYLEWAGWAVGFFFALPRVNARVAAHREARYQKSERARLTRIARLEIACGVGLQYGRDVVMAAPIRVEEHMRALLEQGNGAVYRACWNCNIRFKEFDHPRDERVREVDRALTTRLCPGCIDGARADVVAA